MMSDFIKILIKFPKKKKTQDMGSLVWTSSALNDWRVSDRQTKTANKNVRARNELDIHAFLDRQKESGLRIQWQAWGACFISVRYLWISCRLIWVKQEQSEKTSQPTGRRRRRNKSMVTPVHRFQSIESSTVSEQFRRSYQQPEPQARPESNNGGPCQSPVLSNEPVNESIISRSSPPPELEAPVYIDPPFEGALHVVPHAQLMRLGGLTKYGMWASFGLTTVSVAATKFYVDHQGTFEILLLCTLGALSVGLLVSCVLTVCKRSAPQQFINVQAPQPQHSAIEIEIPEVTSQREIIISPMSNVSQHATTEERTMQDLEQPPPPYHIAILLPLKDSSCADFPPPTYENAVR